MLWRLRSRLILPKFKRNFIEQNSRSLKHIFFLHNNYFKSRTVLAREFSNFKINLQITEKINNFFPTIKEFTKAGIKKLNLNEKRNILSVYFENSKKLDFPVIWLRDNCQCDKCFDVVSSSKIHEPLDFTDEIIPLSIESTKDAIMIIWRDNHRSHFKNEWLCQHSFHLEHQIERMNEQYVQQMSWNSEDFHKLLPKISFLFNDIIKNDDCLLKWLETLAVVGVAKISGAPLERGQLQKLAERVSFIRKTYYGEEFLIKGDKDANNVAYKKGPLQMHTDLPYYNYAPGVVLLHFIFQSTEGGENILADGLNLIKQLPKEVYEILTKTIVDWSDVGCENKYEFCTKNRAPVICADDLGNVKRINWSQPQRDSVFNVSPELALEWYEGYKIFMEIMNDTKNTVILKNDEGSILSFDNRRILHGRTDYRGERFLCGAYLDWDEIYSRIRVLRKKIQTVNDTP